MKQLGSLGGGNHFIEVCFDTEDNVWLMLHSGSRNIGNEVATRHIATAKSRSISTTRFSLPARGAINAEEGRYGIIPGSMGAKSFIIRGLGNPQSFNSCSHRCWPKNVAYQSEIEILDR